MKKKILLLTMLLSISMIACGKETNTQPTNTQAPVVTEAPIPEPTEAPTPEPTEAPTAEPTEAPTPEPTKEPTEVVDNTDDKTSINDIGAGSADGEYQLKEDETIEDIVEQLPDEEETPTEPEQSVRKNTIPEDEIQWYLDTFNLTRNKFDQLTDSQLSKMVNDWLMKEFGGGGSSSGGGSSDSGNSSGGSSWDNSDGNRNTTEDEMGDFKLTDDAPEGYM